MEMVKDISDNTNFNNDEKIKRDLEKKHIFIKAKMKKEYDDKMYDLIQLSSNKKIGSENRLVFLEKGKRSLVDNETISNVAAINCEMLLKYYTYF